MHIAVFGGGIAGLMSAISLGQYGHHSSIYERVWESHEAGMGFILLQEASACLDTFGVRPSGMPLNRYCCRDARGTVLHSQSMPAGALGVRRRELIESLVNALPASGFITVNCALDGIEFDSCGTVAAARLDTGDFVHADIYVGADGMRSRTRHALFPHWPSCPSQVHEITGLVHSVDMALWAGNEFNKFHAAGGGIALGVVPVDPDHVVWYLQFDSQRFTPSGQGPEALLDFVDRMVGEWAAPVPDLLAMTDSSQVYLWRPVDADMVPRFHQDNLVLVGDAAHPLLPFTSQGVCSAICDAVTLADLIGGNNDTTHALSCYSAQRREKCCAYIQEGRKLKERFLMPLSADSLLLPIAD
ncbi:MAG TPA: FAD-dependent monooxygenase [Candidatus Angelobacter sp.]